MRTTLLQRLPDSYSSVTNVYSGLGHKQGDGCSGRIFVIFHSFSKQMPGSTLALFKYLSPHHLLLFSHLMKCCITSAVNNSKLINY